ncbi:MAG: peptidoglycan-binding protein [Deltaproteobacteria bacterium]|nr:peptidoglycan-binding protein [Deltaproteobacteria bacterium]
MPISPLSAPKTRSVTSPSVNETQKAQSTESTAAAETAKPAQSIPASGEQTITPVTQATKEAARTKAGAAGDAVKTRRLQEPPTTSSTSVSRGIQASNLKKGGRGPRVQDLQQRLNDMGAGLSNDGVHGPKTEAAVKAFQTRAGLSPDGIMGPKTMAALDANKEAMQAMPKESLRWGASGDGVSAVQKPAQWHGLQARR